MLTLKAFRRVENRYIRKFFKAGRVSLARILGARARGQTPQTSSPCQIGGLMLRQVFALLWTEPSHDDSRNEEMDDAFSVVRFGQSAYTEIRRFIVVRSFVYHSICM